jgi:hypothetical protein
MRSGDLLHTKFVERVSDVFRRNPTIQYVVAQVGHFREPLPTLSEAQAFASYDVERGDEFFTGINHARNSSAPIAVRRETLKDFPCDEEMSIDFVRSLRFAMLMRGQACAVLNGVYVYLDVELSREIKMPRGWLQVLGYHEMLQKISPNRIGCGSAFLVESARLVAVEKYSQFLAEAETKKATEASAVYEQELEIARLNTFLDARSGSPRRSMWFFPRRGQDYTVLSDTNAFDGKWYLEEYPDVRKAGKDPLKHYIKFGAREGRKPNAFFDGASYSAVNPDVGLSGSNPLVHYLLLGRAEGRRIR